MGTLFRVLEQKTRADKGVSRVQVTGKADVPNTGTTEPQLNTTLVKGLSLLEALARSPSPRGVSDLARELGLAKSNVHRTLQTLISTGYVCPASTAGKYVCTLRLFELASALMSRVDVRQEADPYMQALARTTRETVHLSVLDGTEIIYLHKVESPEPVRAYSTIGGRAPSHCVASGKALLAYQDDTFLAHLPAHLQSFTTHTITDRTALLHELADVRRQGYALNRGEWRESVCGLAAIVFDAAQRPVAAIGISGPVQRLGSARLRGYRGAVIDNARGVSTALGCTDYPDAQTTPARQRGAPQRRSSR